MGKPRREVNNRIECVIVILDLITDLLLVMNNKRLGLNMSYNDLMCCSLYELDYWNIRAEELLAKINKENSDIENMMY